MLRRPYFAADGEIGGMRAGARMRTGPVVVVEGMQGGAPMTFRLEGDSLVEGDCRMMPVEVERYAIGLNARNDGAKNRAESSRTL
jgi:hypothetical protein